MARKPSDGAVEQRSDQKITSSSDHSMSANNRAKQVNISANSSGMNLLMEKQLFTKQGSLCIKFDAKHPTPHSITTTTLPLYGTSQAMEIIASDDKYAIVRTKGQNSDEWVLATHSSLQHVVFGPEVVGVHAGIVPHTHIIEAPLLENDKAPAFEQQKAFDKIGEILSEQLRLAGKEQKITRIRLNTNFITPKKQIQGLAHDLFDYAPIIRRINDFLSLTATSEKATIQNVLQNIRQELMKNHDEGTAALLYDYMLHQSAEQGSTNPANHQARILALYFYCFSDPTMTENTYRCLEQHAKQCADKNLIPNNVFNSKNNISNEEASKITLALIEQAAKQPRKIINVNIFAVKAMPMHEHGVKALAFTQ